MLLQPVLEVENLTAGYRPRRKARSVDALKGVSIRIDAGETLGLVGESGSGKTTLGNAILGLVPVSDGRVLFDGRDIAGLSRADRRELSQHVQVVFQDPYSSFDPKRTVGQAVAETLTVRRDLDRAEIRQRVGDMLERVGIDRGATGRYPGQFSGGQRQRIAIARALLPNPKLVICDEAVSALDLSVQAQVLNLLVDLQREFGLAYLFITHDLAVAQHVCDRVAVLRRGKIVETGDADQVFAKATDPYTQALVAAAPVADPVEQQRRRSIRRELPSARWQME
jgi:ABC-type oligopeptide transport system ATPase subunit